jgi:quercetin dioxygenase-like cupin family protein
VSIRKSAVALPLLALSSLDALTQADPPRPEPLVTPLMTQELSDMPGKEVQMSLIEYPADGADPVHRHDAHGFIYVLEGTVVMQVRGGKRVVLTPGQTFYEGPSDVHVVGENGSRVLPAKFVAVLVKNSGVPAVLPAQ